MTPQTIAAKLRDADSRFYNALQEETKEDIFRDIALMMHDKTGYKIFAMATRNPTFKKLVDEIAPEGLDAKNVTINTDTYINAIEIPRKTMENSKATLGEEFAAPIKGMAADAVGLRMALVTALLEANGNDIFGSAFFAAAKAIWNSDETITNLFTQTGVTAANIKTDYDQVEKEMLSQMNSGGRMMWGPSALKKGLIIMHSPALNSVMEDTFVLKTLSTGGANKYAGKAELRVNPLLTSDNPWYAFIKGATYKSLLTLDEGEPTTADNTGGGKSVERDVQLRDRYTWSARYPVTAAFGLRVGAFKVSA